MKEGCTKDAVTIFANRVRLQYTEGVCIGEIMDGDLDGLERTVHLLDMAIAGDLEPTMDTYSATFLPYVESETDRFIAENSIKGDKCKAVMYILNGDWIEAKRVVKCMISSMESQ